MDCQITRGGGGVGWKRGGSDGETMVDAKYPSSSSPSSVVTPDAGNHDLTPSRGGDLRSKGEEELCPFEEAHWWYRITGKSLTKRCHQCPNADGPYGQCRTREEWKSVDWNKKRGNLKCVECHDHNRGREKPQVGGSRLKERGRESLPQTVLICQPVDTRL